MSRWLVPATLLLAVVVLAVAVVTTLRARPLDADRAWRASPAEEPSAAAGPAAGDWYAIYFTEPKYPDRPETRHGGIDERFVVFIDGAQRSLDIAVYEFDLDNVAEALVRAQHRGVAVRMVMDSDTLENTRDEATRQAVAKLRGAGIPIVGDGRQAIMHHKFAVRDGEEVWTGSWNFTSGDTYRLNNNAVRLRSRELAENFTAEFRKLFEARQFGPQKPKGVPHPSIAIGSARIETYFAPQDGVAGRVAARVREAQQSLHFLAFSFTHDGIAQAVLERAQAGVAVSGVFERTGSETRFSEFGKFKQAGLDVYQDGNPYAMHHKVFIIDGRTVLFGSFNFSDSADRDNDENLLIVDDPGFAQAFEQEFERVLALAKNPPQRERGRSAGAGR
ncbi:MAG TPA: phospholipase D-like domain-containing protein [Chloroflexota bacterium]|nr:phospholipase D-like domain-containing protein [Chloroflexota bacterium]HZU06617.1 phospholipase D-like domain-containing protein [Chloroflexota bacterium]